VVCGMWYVVCGMWYVVCGMWYVVCGRWYVVGGRWYVVGGMWYVVGGRWYVVCITCVYVLCRYVYTHTYCATYIQVLCIVCDGLRIHTYTHTHIHIPGGPARPGWTSQDAGSP
jgi:hypothetical protein